MGNFDVTIARPKTAAGGLNAADLGTAVPTNASDPLDAQKYFPMGYISEDGLSISEDATDDDVVIWGGMKIRKIRSQFGATISGKLLSTRDEKVLKRTFGGGNVEKSGNSLTVKHGVGIAPKSVYVIETLDENGFARRYVVPVGQIMTTGSRSLTHADTDGIEFSIEALPDADGYCYYEYTLLPG